MLTALGYFALILLAVGGRAVYVLLRDSLDNHRVERGRELGHEARSLDLKEREIAVMEAARRSPAIPVAIPSDLYRRITKWGTPEAQDDERKILLDLYQEFQSESDPWASVRAHLPTEPDERWVDTISEGGLVH